MNTANNIHLSKLTVLPCAEIVFSDKPGRALRLCTPHKGEVIIEYHKQKMMREHTADVSELLGQIRNIEDESREYLLNKWVSDFYRYPQKPE